MGQRLIMIAKYCDCLEPYEGWTDYQDYPTRTTKKEFNKHCTKDTAENHNNSEEYQSKNNDKHNETKTQNSLQTLFLKQFNQKKLKQFDLLDEKQLYIHQQNETEQNIFNPHLNNKVQPIKMEEIEISDVQSQRSKKSDDYSIVQLDKLPQIVVLHESIQPNNWKQSIDQKHILGIRQLIDLQKEQYFLDQKDQEEFKQQYHNQ